VFTGAPLIRPASAGSSKPALSYRLVRRLAGLGLIPESRLEAARQKHGSSDYRNASGVMRGVLVKSVSETYEPQLAAMRAARVPSRFIWGAGDTAAPVEAARVAAELAGAPTPTVLEGSAHLLDPALSTAIHAATLELLATVTGSPTPGSSVPE
jgi:pimeloyl-ACP methyl ester carboxylesterase